VITNTEFIDRPTASAERPHRGGVVHLKNAPGIGQKRSTKSRERNRTCIPVEETLPQPLLKFANANADGGLRCANPCPGAREALSVGRGNERSEPTQLKVGWSFHSVSS
jgi:hypothetical protein